MIRSVDAAVMGESLFASVDLRTDRDVLSGRKRVGEALDRLKTRALRRTKFITAVSEIARNAVVHGGGGKLEIYVQPVPAQIRVVCRDEGPGIPDIDAAMTDGFSTAKSLGKGLGGASRLVDTFHLECGAEGGPS